MRKFICLFILSFLIVFDGKSQTWPWAVRSTGTGVDGVHGMSCDGTGNIFATGCFSSPVMVLGTYSLTNAGSFNVFLAKFDALGNVQWAMSFGGTNDDEGFSVATDPAGNAFVTGFFSSPTMILGTYTLTNTGHNDIFIAKVSPAGTVLWAESAGGTGSDEAMSVASDHYGNAYVTGYYATGLTIGTNSFTSAGNSDIFLAKYNSAGSVVWARTAGGTLPDEGLGLAIDAVGSVYITGEFLSPTITAGTFSLSTAGGFDIFMIKYDTSGNVRWAQSAGGVNDDYGSAVAHDPFGKIYFTGYFHSPSLSFGSNIVNSAGNFDAYLVKCDTSGTYQWAQDAGGTGIDKGFALITDGSGNVFLTGWFTSPTIYFGTSPLSPPSASIDPLFIVKYDKNGNVLCTSALGSGGYFPNGIAVDDPGNVYVGSAFEMNPFIIGSDTLVKTGTENVYVAQFKCTITTGESDVLSNLSQVKIYPNPSSGKIMLSVGNPTNRNLHIEIFSALGEKIYDSVQSGEAIVALDLAFLQKGIYFLHTQAGNQTNAQRIIIE